MNKIRGKVKKVHSFENISLVEIQAGKEIFKSVIVETLKTSPYLKEEKDIFILFKETEVAIGKDCKGKISLSNQINCKIKEIKKGKILTQLKLYCKDFEIKSIITTFSAEKLSLKNGDNVVAFIKANEVFLMEIFNE